MDSVDAWVGMLAEDHVGGSTLGITATTIIAEQFTRLRDGDRFYYENVFTGRQLEQIDGTTLADVIQRNTSLELGRDKSVFFATADVEESQNRTASREQQATENRPQRGGPLPPPPSSQKMSRLLSVLAAAVNEYDANSGDEEEASVTWTSAVHPG